MNPEVATPDETLAAIPKPKLSVVKRLVLDANDWLVLCAGFEDRSLTVIQKATSTSTGFKVLLLQYEPSISENKVLPIENICTRSRCNITRLIYDRESPAGFGERMLTVLDSYPGRVFIDISGMSRLLVVQVLVALAKRSNGFAASHVLYTEAKEYPPTQEEAEAEIDKSGIDPSFQIFFFSSGVSEVTIIPELATYSLTGLQNRLVAFPSLDSHQLIALRAELQPSRLSIIEGIPPDKQNKWREKVIAQVNNLDELSQSDRYRASTLYYNETLSALLDIYQRFSVHERILVSPTGSKMQAVAVGIFRAFLADVQIVYPTPRDFLKPERYTRGFKRTHMLSLESFSPLQVQ